MMPNQFYVYDCFQIFFIDEWFILTTQSVFKLKNSKSFESIKPIQKLNLNGPENLNFDEFMIFLGN
jgi:hypothetical protein